MDQMATVPVQLLNEVEMFIANHRGITHREAEMAINSLRQYARDGAALYAQNVERTTKLEDELKLMHEKLAQMERKPEETP